jgi:formate--tetrahydrofolate ligase
MLNRGEDAEMVDQAIAVRAPLLPIPAVGQRLGIAPEALELYGPFKAKIAWDFVERAIASPPRGKLILVTAISPTPAGEGKTTTSIGLGDALNSIGKSTAICLREPSLGPCFGQKGGATGGGRAQMAPADDINLHFTGDLHAIGAANNLLAAMIDNHIHWGNALDIDPERIVWRRCLDISDRALRAAFDITAASEVMAILCLASSRRDLERRLSNIVVAYNRAGSPVTADQLGAPGAMVALLKDAIKPNLVQTLEGNPVLVHGGPFANIAHGCNSAIATRLGLGLADYVVTEAGFGADLGAEKFFDIKCRQAGLTPALTVIVTTVRALKFHGGVAREDLGKPNAEAVALGMHNLLWHIATVRKFRVPVVVAINHFTADTEAETDTIQKGCAAVDVEAVLCTHWADGGAGAEALAHLAVRQVADAPAAFRPLYPDSLPLVEKIGIVAREVHGASEVRFFDQAAAQIKAAEALGYGGLPVCIAKTQYAPTGGQTLGVLEVREARLAAGAQFLVAICGKIFTMPGLPRHPAALDIRLGEDGVVIAPGW